jgi:hypothetical protein
LVAPDLYQGSGSVGASAIQADGFAQLSDSLLRPVRLPVKKAQMCVTACEVWFYLNNLAEKIFGVSFAMLQDSDYSQQIQSAVLFGRGVQHRLQFVFGALLIPGSEELSRML